MSLEGPTSIIKGTSPVNALPNRLHSKARIGIRDTEVNGFGPYKAYNSPYASPLGKRKEYFAFSWSTIM